VFSKTSQLALWPTQHPAQSLLGFFPVGKGTTVAQWLRRCATNWKVAGSIPAGVSGFFIDI